MPLLDNTEIRSQFPAADVMLYLDAAHQTPLCVPVRARLDAFYDEALYTAGPKARWLARIAREGQPRPEYARRRIERRVVSNGTDAVVR